MLHKKFQREKIQREFLPFKSFCQNHPLGADDLPVGDEGVEVHARREVFASDVHAGFPFSAASIGSILYRPS